MEEEALAPLNLFMSLDNLLILGNGFDLSLGLPTRYSDFFKSREWPFIKENEHVGKLGNFLREKGEVETWFDLEYALAEYGQIVDRTKRDSVEDEENEYETLVSQLSKYLIGLDYSSINLESSAASVLSAACENIAPAKIYTFNYTNLNAIGQRLGLTGIIDVAHIHGSLLGNDIILGVGDNIDLGNDSDFLYKTNNRMYKSTDLLSDLFLYKNIIIFGLSLTPMDYPYFEDLFSALSRGDLKDRYIRIVTYDDRSRRNILHNIREMNKGILKLINYPDFDIITTASNADDNKMAEMIRVIHPKIELDV